jgi:hypothetical protein
MCTAAVLCVGVCVYALVSLWAFYLSYRSGYLVSLVRHDDATVWRSSFQDDTVSALHSETISGRGGLSHYWTALALAAGVLGALGGAPLRGMEQAPLFFLALVPLRSPADKVCGFIVLPDWVSVPLHYSLVGGYVGASLLPLYVAGALATMCVVAFMSAVTIFMLSRGHAHASLAEAVLSTCISASYVHVTLGRIDCGR